MKTRLLLVLFCLFGFSQSLNAAVQSIVIAIDAGHGGKDSGAIGQHGTYEKDVVLAISEQLKTALMGYEGIKPVLIRSDDKFLSLLERRDLAEKHYGADMFLSIHADSVEEHWVSGASIFVLSEQGASSARARYLAEIQAVDEQIQVSAEESQEILDIIADLTTEGTLEHNAIAAKMILRALANQRIKLSRTVPEYADFGVLKSSKMLALLIETGFISNAEDEKKLIVPVYQDQVAKAIAKGVHEYYQQFPIPGSIYDHQITVLKYTVERGDSLYGLARKWQVSVSDIKRWNKLTSNQINIGQVLEIHQ